VNAPTREDADRLDARAHENLRLADAAGDDAIRRDRLRQAAAAYSQAGRVIGAVADAIPAAPEAASWGMDLNFGAPWRPAAYGPGPR
jgi:hypothetical protein